MNKLMQDIVSYLDYLNSTLELCTSVHFNSDKLRYFSSELFSMLLPYNVHNNPYCALVKKECWMQCIQEQRKIMSRQDGKAHFCQTCYAGVYEYICQITEGKVVIGYIAVSGYRSNALHEGCLHEESWMKNLCEGPLPIEVCNAVIPPLCRMFELLFTYPLEEDVQGDYHLLLQYLHERHGQVTLNDLCQHFGRSKSYISHMFSDNGNMTLPAYCNELKLNHAKELLGIIHMSITDIAMDVGYNDVSYFILLFKEKFGVTPLQYRKMIISKTGKPVLLA